MKSNKYIHYFSNIYIFIIILFFKRLTRFKYIHKYKTPLLRQLKYKLKNDFCGIRSQRRKPVGLIDNTLNFCNRYSSVRSK